MSYNQTKYINKWLEYKWVKGYHPDALIHPDDLQFFAPGTGVSLAHCVGESDDYLILRTCEKTIRARAHDGIRILPDSKFSCGDLVVEAMRPDVSGLISKITWHFKDSAYMYFIEVNGKLKSRRYRAEELKSVHDNAQ